MTPVPLDLPLRPSEAAELANLVFDQAERKPLTDDIRNRIAARGSVLRLETVTPRYGSLERDPIHPSSYYMAVDGSEREPLLLHMAPAAAPTSGIFQKPLLIGRMRRANGPEMVINAIPFGASDDRALDQFTAGINKAFLPRSQGVRPAILVEASGPQTELPALFDAFRAILKRTGKNLAGVSNVGYPALWAAIRAGWREGYVARGAGDTTRVQGASPAARREFMLSRYSIEMESVDECALQTVDRLHETIRQARVGAKAVPKFDFELSFKGAADPVAPEELAFCLGWLKSRGHPAHFVAHGLPGAAELAAVCRQFQCGLTLRLPAGCRFETVAAIVRAMAGRVNFVLSGSDCIAAAAECLLG